ncbi:hypothetical protein OAJ60_03495 [Planctomycetaceae bacterium]|nr:hypothetical protein [Planctomycetaceae bacterium]
MSRTYGVRGQLVPVEFGPVSGSFGADACTKWRSRICVNRVSVTLLAG